MQQQPMERQALPYNYERTRQVAKISRIMTSVGCSAGLVQVLVHALLACMHGTWDLHYISRLSIIIPCHLGLVYTQLWAFFRIHNNLCHGWLAYERTRITAYISACVLHTIMAIVARPGDGIGMIALRGRVTICGMLFAAWERVRLADLIYVIQPFHVASFVLIEAKHCRTTGACTPVSVTKEIIVFCIVALVTPALIMWYSESQQRRGAPAAQLTAMNTPSFAHTGGTGQQPPTTR